MFKLAKNLESKDKPNKLNDKEEQKDESSGEEDEPLMPGFEKMEASNNFTTLPEPTEEEIAKDDRRD